jgi:hypothetical protein
MRYNMNTKQARKLVNALIAQKNTAVWRTWTNGVQKDLDKDATKRNLCYGILGDKFTEGECKWIKLLVGCDKVHFTDNGRYLRLLGVKYEG